MKLKTTLLPLFTAAFGAVGLLFRFWVHSAGTDAEGLVITGHPATTVMMLLLAAMAVILAAVAIFMEKTPTAFKRSTAGAVGCYIGAAGLLITAFLELSSMPAGREQMALADLAGVLSVLFGFASVVVLILMGNRRKQGKPLNVWAYVVIVVFFVFHLLQQYQLWTRQPQINDYLFPLLGSVFLMLAVYHRACKDLGQSAEAQYLIFSQAALFCSMMSTTGQSKLFYITMAAWTLLDSLPGKEEQ